MRTCAMILLQLQYVFGFHKIQEITIDRKLVDLRVLIYGVSYLVRQETVS
jgi:hypothetical protein